MTKLIDYEAMEGVLLANWDKFMDHKRLMATVLAHARDADLHIDTEATQGKEILKQTKVSLSRFQPAQGGFLVWADFSVPKGGGIRVGTAELFARLDGTVEFRGMA